jgi:hypothetical protein
MMSLPIYCKSLEAGDTFFMNRQFGELVDHARRSVPEDLVFENTWLEAPSGWMWLETPFEVPEFVVDTPEKTVEDQLKKISNRIRIRAVGWFPVPPGIHAETIEGTNIRGERISGEGATQFLCYIDFGSVNSGSYGFGCWSHFMLMNGDKLSDRIRQFEKLADNDGGAYEKSRASDILHEIRWVYSAFHLMAQRLTHHSTRTPDRSTRRRAERNRTVLPSLIHIISLRRLEEERSHIKTGDPKNVDWQWQWSVRGHWRNQYYASEDVHRQVFIESYIKGPDDKPLKPPGLKIFTAVR